MNKEEFFIWFPIGKDKKIKKFVETICTNKISFLSTENIDDAYPFDTAEEARVFIKNMAPPFNTHAYNIIKRKGKKEELVPLVSPVRGGREAPKPNTPAPATAKPKSGAVGEILKLATEGKSKKDIIALGYNKNTVNRQVGEWLKKQIK